MKTASQGKTLSFISTIICLSFLNCTKEDEPTETFFPGSQAEGFFQATKNGNSPWAASGRTQRDPYCPDLTSIQGYTFDKYGQLRETLFLNEIPLAVGTYILASGKVEDGDGIAEARYHRSISDGDVSGASYNLFGFKPQPNSVKITVVDSTNNIIKGAFNLAFYIQDSDRNKGFPNSVQFENGTFEVNFPQ